MFIDGVCLHVSNCKRLSVRSLWLSLATERDGKTPSSQKTTASWQQLQYTHTRTHTHTRKHSHLCSVVSSPFCQHLHRFRHTQTHKEYSQFVSLSSPARTPLPISLIHDPAASELVLSNSSSSPPSLSLCRSLTWSDFSCILAILTGGCGGIPSWQFYSTHYKWLNGIHAGPAG